MMDEQPGELNAPGLRINVRNQSSYSNTVTIPNATAQDASLSWAARGLLTFMLSMPSDWIFHEYDLINRSPLGRDHLRSIVRELEAHGYLERRQGRNQQGRQSSAHWRIWDRPQTVQRTGATPWTDYPSTENPSTVKSPALTALSPSTDNPSTVETAPWTGKPLTGKPSTENPSAYKKNNKQINPPFTSSLRSEVPPTGGNTRRSTRSRSVIQVPDRGSDSSTNPNASPEAASRPRKAPEPLPASTDTSNPTAGASQARRARSVASAILPDFAEPVRPLLESWWRLRRTRHRADAAAALSPRSVNALAYAHQHGVLQQFAELAAESGWLSLGFNGHRDFIAKLAADLNDHASRSGSCMVSMQTGRGPGRRPTSRQADAADRAIAMFSDFTEPSSAETCSLLPISSMS